MFLSELTEEQADLICKYYTTHYNKPGVRRFSYKGACGHCPFSADIDGDYVTCAIYNMFHELTEEELKAIGYGQTE